MEKLRDQVKSDAVRLSIGDNLAQVAAYHVGMFEALQLVEDIKPLEDN